MAEPTAALQRLVRQTARAMARHGLVTAFGHVSARIDDARFLVCAPRPMGLIAAGEAGTVVAVDGPLPDGVLGEVRVHQQIYKRRPEVGGVCRVLPPSVIILSTLGVTPRPRHGPGAYFAPRPPLWEDTQLLRTEALAAGVAETLGGARAVVMRGNGAVSVGANPEEAACNAYFLEEAARVELAVAQAPGLGSPVVYTDDEVKARAVATGGIFERLWEFMTAGDSEA